VLGGLVGAWLFASAFLWPHGFAQLHNAWLVGALVMACAAAALTGYERARQVTAALSIWLFVSNLILPTGLETAWNHALVAVVLFFLSRIPTGRARPLAPALAGPK
jgi:hypothetical protein